MLDHRLHKTTTVINKLGLHARPAAMIANLAMNARSEIQLIKDGEPVDASSIIDILSLACVQGTKIALTAGHPDDACILDNIIQLFETGFGE